MSWQNILKFDNLNPIFGDLKQKIENFFPTEFLQKTKVLRYLDSFQSETDNTDEYGRDLQYFQDRFYSHLQMAYDDYHEEEGFKLDDLPMMVNSMFGLEITQLLTRIMNIINTREVNR